MIKPPFNYTGNKNRLVNEFSNSFFPKEKSIRFLDMFGGGGTISINVDYDFIAYNDNSKWIPFVINILKKQSIGAILSLIKFTIDKWKLSSTHFYGQSKYKSYRKGNNGLKEFNEKKFYKFRNNINKRILNDDKNESFYIDILTLMFYSFNNDIRFNNGGLINIPIGKTDFNSQAYDKLITFAEAIKRKKIHIYRNDFRKLNLEKFDFIYADPPYLISEAVYNKSWSEKDEKELYKILIDFSKNGGKFVLSNVLKSKGKTNKFLIEFANDNNFKIKKLDYSYKSASYNRNRKDVDEEVIVTNV